MVTKYDVFELMYQKGVKLNVNSILEGLEKPKTYYKKIHAFLLDLVKDKLVRKQGSSFEIIKNFSTQKLHTIITYCLNNDVNYNVLIDKNLAEFIHKGFIKRRFTIKDFKINPRKFKTYIQFLYKNGFLIILSKKPLICLIPYNSFLGELVHYFGFKVFVAKEKDDDYIIKIINELRIFKKLKEKDERKYHQILEELKLKFIHHSLSLEGNPITLSDTKKILKYQIVPEMTKIEDVLEIQNYQKAVLELIQRIKRKELLSKELILTYHFLAMNHHEEFAGKIRTVGVYIRGNPNFKVAKPQEIENRLDKLFVKYQNFIKKKKSPLGKILEFSAYFHNEFQHIHPFEDGNSRTTRLILMHFLMNNQIPFIDIPLGFLEEYMSSTKKSKKRDDKQLQKVIEKVIFYNLKRINEQLV